jgi:hypothetical protein
MSENDKDKDTEEYSEKPQKVEITVKKDSDEKLEDVKAERDDYLAKLEIIAQKEFDKRRRELGAPEDIDTPEKLEGYKAAKKNNDAPSGTIPLSAEQLGDFSEDKVNSDKSVHEMEFDSIGEMLAVLEERNKKGDKEAGKVLGKLAQKSMRSTKEFEFEGELLKGLQRLDKEGKEERQKEIKKWSRKK